MSALSTGLEWWLNTTSRTLYMRANGTAPLPTDIVTTNLKTLVRGRGVVVGDADGLEGERGRGRGRGREGGDGGEGERVEVRG